MMSDSEKQSPGFCMAKTNKQTKKGKKIDTKLTSVKTLCSHHTSTAHVFDMVLISASKKTYIFYIPSVKR